MLACQPRRGRDLTTVHLFIHYRMHGPDYATYVQQAKQLFFPNAKIIAGAYGLRPAGTTCLAFPAPAPKLHTAQQGRRPVQHHYPRFRFQMLKQRESSTGSNSFPNISAAEETWPGLETNPPRMRCRRPD